MKTGFAVVRHHLPSLRRVTVDLDARPGVVTALLIYAFLRVRDDDEGQPKIYLLESLHEHRPPRPECSDGVETHVEGVLRRLPVYFHLELSLVWVQDEAISILRLTCRGHSCTRREYNAQVWLLEFVPPYVRRCCCGGAEKYCWGGVGAAAAAPMSARETQDAKAPQQMTAPTARAA